MHVVRKKTIQIFWDIVDSHLQGIALGKAGDGQVVACRLPDGTQDGLVANPLDGQMQGHH
jgi:hypothetical protein